MKDNKKRALAYLLSVLMLVTTVFGPNVALAQNVIKVGDNNPTISVMEPTTNETSTNDTVRIEQPKGEEITPIISNQPAATESSADSTTSTKPNSMEISPMFMLQDSQESALVFGGATTGLVAEKRTTSTDKAKAELFIKDPSSSDTEVAYCLESSDKSPIEGVTYSQGNISLKNSVLRAVYNGYNNTRDISFFTTAFGSKSLRVTDLQVREATQRAIYYLIEEKDYTLPENPSQDEMNVFYIYEFLTEQTPMNSNNPLLGETLKVLPESYTLKTYTPSDAQYQSLLGTNFYRSIYIQKNWQNVDGSVKVNPDVKSVDLILISNDTSATNRQLTFTSTSIEPWKGKISGLPVYIKGTSNPVLYSLSEIQVPGYEKGLIRGEGSLEKPFVLTNKEKPVTNKKDVVILKTDNLRRPLEGAQLEVQNLAGQTLDSWISSEKGAYNVSLEPGDYKLVEVSAPKGYKKAAAIPFTVSNQNLSLLMIDELEGSDYNFFYNRIAPTTYSTPVVGATIQLLQGNKVLGVWVSNGKYAASKLPPGDYVIHEVATPEGQKTPADVKFTVGPNGEIIPTLAGEMRLGALVPTALSAVQAPTPEQFKAQTGQPTPQPGQPTPQPGGTNTNNQAGQPAPGSNLTNSSIQLIKQDASTKLALPGAEFSLYLKGKDQANPSDGAGNKMANVVITSDSTLDTLPVKLYKDGAELQSFDINKADTKLDFGANAKGEYTLNIEPVTGKDINVSIENGTFKVAITDLGDATGAGTVSNTAKINFSDTNEGELKGSYTTDQKGTITLDKLPVGDYYFIETKAPAGYQGDFTKKIEFSVTENMTAPIVLRVDNTKIGALANNTGSAGNSLRDSKGRLIDPKGGAALNNPATRANTAGPNPRTLIQGYAPHIAAIVLAGSGLAFADIKRRKNAKLALEDQEAKDEDIQ